MFTDDEARPTRVELLLDLLRSQPKRKWLETQVAHLLQPAVLPGVTEKSGQAGAMIRAAVELGLVERGKDSLRATSPPADQRDSRTILCEALDEHVLSSLAVEPYFAPFYSFALGLGKDADIEWNREQWAQAFRNVYPLASQANPFNKDKHLGLHKWYSYAGLGWYDTRDVFQCDPYERLLRCLPRIFGKKTDLAATDFMNELANECPELDGGEIYRKVNPAYDHVAKRITLGVSRALVELHQDKILRLSCPTDSDGWWIEEADPGRDGEHIQSDRVDQITWLAQGAPARTS